MKICRALQGALRSSRARNASQIGAVQTRAGSAQSCQTRWYSEASRPASRSRRSPSTVSKSPENQGKEAGSGTRKVTEEEQPEAPQKSSFLRKLMRHVPHNVSILTTVHVPQAEKPGSAQSARSTETPSTTGAVRDSQVLETIPRAMTLSSFTSLSLNPPRVTFNVQLPSSTYEAIMSSGRFNIHVLRNSPQAAAIAGHFTRGNVAHPDKSSDSPGGLPDLFDNLHKLGLSVNDEKTWSYDSGPLRAKVPADGKKMKIFRTPLLEGKDVLYVLRCRMVGLYKKPPTGVMVLNDRAIVVGDVRSWVIYDEIKDRDVSLMYVDQAYREVGKRIGPAASTNSSGTGSGKT